VNENPAVPPEQKPRKAPIKLNWHGLTLIVTAVAAVAAMVTAIFSWQATNAAKSQVKASRAAITAQTRPVLLGVQDPRGIRLDITRDQLFLEIVFVAAGPGYAHLHKADVFASDDPRLCELPGRSASSPADYVPAFQPPTRITVSIGIAKDLRTNGDAQEFARHMRTGGEIRVVVWYTDILDQRRFRTIVSYYRAGPNTLSLRNVPGANQVLPGWAGAVE
jgi:hypothetical protein